MNNRNFRKEMDNIISNFGECVPTLLLHSCCAPCSSACLEMLAPYFHVTVLYYNPNITSPDEYNKRLEEERRFIDQINEQGGFCAKSPANTNNDDCNQARTASAFHPIKLIDGRYEPLEFFDIAKGLDRIQYAVGPAECLNQAMRLQVLVYPESVQSSSIKAGQEHVYDQQQVNLTVLNPEGQILIVVLEFIARGIKIGFKGSIIVFDNTLKEITRGLVQGLVIKVAL